MLGFSFFTLFFLNISLLIAQPIYVDVASEAAILINQDTGKILFEKNLDKLLFPASITKVATALYILKKYEPRLNEAVCAKREALASITSQAKKQSNYRCPAYWLETDGTHIGIKVGEEFTVKTLLIAMLVASANDAANVLAEHFEGSIIQFMAKLNAFLKEIGCKNTTFYNPHGLHHPEHKTTALDMSIIAKEAMKYGLFQQIVAMTTFVCPRTNLSEERYLTQTNLLLRSGSHYYKKAIGVKTGSTSQAGKTLVASAKNSDRNLMAVVLGSNNNQERYGDVTKLFEKTFNEKKLCLTLLPKGIQKIKVKIKGGQKSLRSYLTEPLTYNFYPSEKEEVKAKIVWSFKKLPIEKGEKVGEARAYDTKGSIVSKKDLFALEKIEATFFYCCKQFLVKHQWLLIKIAMGGIVIIALLSFLRRKKRYSRL